MPNTNCLGDTRYKMIKISFFQDQPIRFQEISDEIYLVRYSRDFGLNSNVSVEFLFPFVSFLGYG